LIHWTIWTPRFLVGVFVTKVLGEVIFVVDIFSNISLKWFSVHTFMQWANINMAWGLIYEPKSFLFIIQDPTDKWISDLHATSLGTLKFII
jgi:hypothetical protein